MQSYQFKQCTVSLLDKTFGIRQGKKSPVLNDWMKSAKSVKLKASEKAVLNLYQETLISNLVSWNEQELALNFIGPVVALVQIGSDEKGYNLFAERPVSGILTSVNGEDIAFNGKPDTFIASGFREPEIPFFSFHEHKPEIDGSGDPVGQVLAAMLVGQQQNIDAALPIYGCYVIGQNWYFLVLEGKKYTIASPFATTNKEIFDVFKVLKALKSIVEDRVSHI
jgi:hypothetical protein